MNIDYNLCELVPLNNERAADIAGWEYPAPYVAYSFKGRPNGYLKDSSSFGKEQFCLVLGEETVGQVACQMDGGMLWVGWALNPAFCGHGTGYLFVEKCITEIRKVKNYRGAVYLRVAKSNVRALKAYLKGGFEISGSTIDEIAYSEKPEEFYIMSKK